MSPSVAAKQRLEQMLSKAQAVRRTYRSLLATNHTISDRDLTRSLDENEAKLLHNAWMNDVSEWMNAECLAQYNQLLKNDIQRQGQGQRCKSC